MWLTYIDDYKLSSNDLIHRKARNGCRDGGISWSMADGDIGSFDRPHLLHLQKNGLEVPPGMLVVKSSCGDYSMV